VLHDEPGAIDAIRLGHAHVHQDHVGVQFLTAFQHRLAVGCETNDLDPSSLQLPAHGVGEDEFIFGDQDAQCGSSFSGLCCHGCG